jgi:hypothetical protein
MADSASIQIILNASGNLGAAVDAASGKVIALGRAAKGAGGTVSKEVQQAQQSIATLGIEASKAFGGAGSALGKFAGPLGALGGVAAVAGLAISTALDLARAKFSALIEEPVKLAKAMQDAAASARELAKARDAAILGNIDKAGGAAEPLVARGGGQLLALARQISTETGVPLDDVSKAVQAGSNKGLSDEALRRLVQGAQLASRSGRMGFADAVTAGVANRVDAGFSPAETAADMVNREALEAHRKTATDERLRQLDMHNRAQDKARAAFNAKRQADYDRAQLAYNLGGQVGDAPQIGPEFTPAPFRSTVRFKPTATAADFASVEANLAASPVAQAIQAKRLADAAAQDKGLTDIETRGGTVVGLDEARARADRRFPGLAKFQEEDGKLAADGDVASKRAEAWSFLGPWNPHWGEVKRIADERNRRRVAFQGQGGFVGQDDAETVDQFNARVTAQKDNLDQVRRKAGVPFGEGTSKIEMLLEKIAQNTGDVAPAPVPNAQ